MAYNQTLFEKYMFYNVIYVCLLKTIKHYVEHCDSIIYGYAFILRWLLKNRERHLELFVYFFLGSGPPEKMLISFKNCLVV